MGPAKAISACNDLRFLLPALSGSTTSAVAWPSSLYPGCRQSAHYIEHDFTVAITSMCFKPRDNLAYGMTFRL